MFGNSIPDLDSEIFVFSVIMSDVVLRKICEMNLPLPELKPKTSASCCPLGHNEFSLAKI